MVKKNASNPDARGPRANKSLKGEIKAGAKYSPVRGMTVLLSHPKNVILKPDARINPFIQTDAFVAFGDKGENDLLCYTVQ
jgi:hypothetical protein